MQTPTTRTELALLCRTRACIKTISYRSTVVYVWSRCYSVLYTVRTTEREFQPAVATGNSTRSHERDNKNQTPGRVGECFQMSAWPRYPGKREAVGGETVSARAQLVVRRSSLTFFCPVGAHTSTSQRLEQNGITDYLGIKIVGHQARGQRPGCRTHTVPGRPGCGPGLGLTWPASLDPGTIITVGFRKASVILAYVVRTPLVQ